MSQDELSPAPFTRPRGKADSGLRPSLRAKESSGRGETSGRGAGQQSSHLLQRPLQIMPEAQSSSGPLQAPIRGASGDLLVPEESGLLKSERATANSGATSQPIKPDASSPSFRLLEQAPSDSTSSSKDDEEKYDSSEEDMKDDIHPLERMGTSGATRYRASTMIPYNQSDEEDEFYEDNGLWNQLVETLRRDEGVRDADAAFLSAEATLRDSNVTDISVIRMGTGRSDGSALPRDSRPSAQIQPDFKALQLSDDIRLSNELVGHPTRPRRNGFDQHSDFKTMHSAFAADLLREVFGNTLDKRSVRDLQYNPIRPGELGFTDSLEMAFSPKGIASHDSSRLTAPAKKLIGDKRKKRRKKKRASEPPKPTATLSDETLLRLETHGKETLRLDDWGSSGRPVVNRSGRQAAGKSGADDFYLEKKKTKTRSIVRSFTDRTLRGPRKPKTRPPKVGPSQSSFKSDTKVGTPKIRGFMDFCSPSVVPDSPEPSPPRPPRMKPTSFKMLERPRHTSGRGRDRSPSPSPKAPFSVLYPGLGPDFPTPPKPPKARKKKGGRKTHGNSKSFDLHRSERVDYWKRKEAESNEIERSIRKRYADMDLNKVHKKFKFPISEVQLSKTVKIPIKDLRPGDLIFIFDYSERGDKSHHGSGTQLTKGSDLTPVPPPPAPAKPPGIGDSLTVPPCSLLPTRQNNHVYFNPDYFKGRDRDPREESPSLDDLARNRGVSTQGHFESKLQAAEQKVKIRAKHVMVVTSVPNAGGTVWVTHVTQLRARRNPIRTSSGPTEAQLMRRMSYMSMGFSQRGTLPLAYQGIVYRLTSNPSLGYNIAEVAEKLVARGIFVPRVHDVPKVITRHEGGYLKKSKVSLFRRLIREEFDSRKSFTPVYPSEFVVLSIQRAMYKSFKEGQKFEEIVGILDYDPVNPWTSVTQSYIEDNPNWRTLGKIDLEFGSDT